MPTCLTFDQQPEAWAFTYAIQLSHFLAMPPAWFCLVFLLFKLSACCDRQVARDKQLRCFAFPWLVIYSISALFCQELEILNAVRRKVALAWYPLPSFISAEGSSSSVREQEAQHNIPWVKLVFEAGNIKNKASPAQNTKRCNLFAFNNRAT